MLWISPQRLPCALPHSRHTNDRVTPEPVANRRVTRFSLGGSLRAWLYAQTPRLARQARIFGNKLMHQPEKPRRKAAIAQAMRGILKKQMG